LQGSINLCTAIDCSTQSTAARIDDQLDTSLVVLEAWPWLKDTREHLVKVLALALDDKVLALRKSLGFGLVN